MSSEQEKKRQEAAAKKAEAKKLAEEEEAQLAASSKKTPSKSTGTKVIQACNQSPSEGTMKTTKPEASPGNSPTTGCIHWSTGVTFARD